MLGSVRPGVGLQQLCLPEWAGSLHGVWPSQAWGAQCSPRSREGQVFCRQRQPHVWTQQFLPPAVEWEGANRSASHLSVPWLLMVPNSQQLGWGLEAFLAVSASAALQEGHS